MKGSSIISYYHKDKIMFVGGGKFLKEFDPETESVRLTDIEL